MFIFTVGCYCAGLVPKTLNEGEILLVLLVGLYWIWEGMCWGTVKAFENWVWVWVILIGWLKLPFKLWLDFGSSWCWLMLLKFKKCWLWWVLLGVWVPKDIVLKSKVCVFCKEWLTCFYCWLWVVVKFVVAGASSKLKISN